VDNNHVSLLPVDAGEAHGIQPWRGALLFGAKLGRDGGEVILSNDLERASVPDHILACYGVGPLVDVETEVFYDLFI